jgi:hypothetical protein
MKQVLLVLLIFLISSCSILQRSYEKKIASIHKEIQPSEINEKIPAIKLRADIDKFIQILEEVHVNPYLKISKESFYHAADSLKKSITDSLTRQQFYQVFTPFVDLLNDSHTGVKFPEGIWKYNQYVANGLYFPIDVLLTSDKRIYVKYDYSENNILQQAQILSINSVKAEEIINTFLKYEQSPVEKSSIKRLEGKFIDFMWWVLDFKGPYTVETNIGTYKVEGQTWDQYKKNRSALKQAINKSQDNKTLKTNTDKTFLLKISSFSGSPSEFKTKMEEQFKTIQLKGYDNLIIDVRDNSGGNDDNARTIIDYITSKPYSEALSSVFIIKRSKRLDNYFRLQYKGTVRWMITIRTATWFDKEFRKVYKSYLKTPYGENDTIYVPLKAPHENPYRFKGKVYVLANHNSYSATTAFLGAIKDYGIGTIIGTESGDNPTEFGNNYYFELPNTRLLCHSSATFMVRPSGGTDMTHGVIPDYYIEQTIEDTNNNIDTALEYTLRLINK